jgi:hypothetical protein
MAIDSIEELLSPIFSIAPLLTKSRSNERIWLDVSPCILANSDEVA